MPTYFYNRSPFRILKTHPPLCFENLDVTFDKCGLDITHPTVKLAENLCKRLGDVAYYAAKVDSVAVQRSSIEAAVEMSALLGGHFGACKSVLDAGAITLSEIYQIGEKSIGRRVSKGQLDLWRGSFRNALRQEIPALGLRIDLFANLFREVTEWRDSVVHRVQPLVVVHSKGPPELAPIEAVSIKLLNKQESDWSSLIPGGEELPWVEPLYFHKRWYPQLESFCAVICDSLADSTGQP